MRRLRYLLPLLAWSLVALASSGCVSGAVGPGWSARPPRPMRSTFRAPAGPLLPSGAQVTTDANPHPVPGYRTPTWDRRTTARTEAVAFGGLVVVAIATQCRRHWASPCLAFGEPLRIMPTRFGVPFKWVGVSRNPLFSDTCHPRLTHPGDELLRWGWPVP